MIKIGSLNISSFKLGGADCSIYLGSVKLYPTEEPTPPQYEGFCKLSINNGDVIELEGSGELTSAMTSTYKSTLVSAEIGTLCTSIGNRAFQNCTGLTSVIIPDSVTSISALAFYQCTSLPIIDNIRYADTYAVEAVDKTLSTYTIKDKTRFIGDYAFSNCTLTSVTIPNSVTSIGTSAFEACSGLTSVTIPNSVTTIGASAFNSCDGLTSVTIGESVTSIGNYAFNYCSSLTSVTVNATTPPTLLGNRAFYNTNNCPIYVPSTSIDAYKSASGWSTYASRIQAIPT